LLRQNTDGYVRRFNQYSERQNAGLKITDSMKMGVSGEVQTFTPELQL
jgi:hypothetical protein